MSRQTREPNEDAALKGGATCKPGSDRLLLGDQLEAAADFRLLEEYW